MYKRQVHGAAGAIHDHGGYHDVPGEAEKEAGRHADPGLRPVLIPHHRFTQIKIKKGRIINESMHNLW